MKQRKNPIRKSFFLAALLAVSSGFYMPDYAVEPAKKVVGYELEQLTSLNGKFKVFVSSDAVRVDHLSYGFSFIARAPLWEVTVFRPDSKQYALVSYKDWLKTNLILVSTLWTMELKKPLSSRHFEQNGVAYINYIFPSTSATGGYFRGDHGSDFKDLENNRGEVMSLDFPADIHAGGIIGRVVCLPELSGVPVQVTRKSAKVSSWSLKTIKTKHSDSLSAELFKLPAGYKKVPFNRSLFSSSTQKEDIDDMFGMGGK